jgi:hypothetical protein
VWAEGVGFVLAWMKEVGIGLIAICGGVGDKRFTTRLDLACERSGTWCKRQE